MLNGSDSCMIKAILKVALPTWQCMTSWRCLRSTHVQVISTWFTAKHIPFVFIFATVIIWVQQHLLMLQLNLFNRILSGGSFYFRCPQVEMPQWPMTQPQPINWLAKQWSGFGHIAQTDHPNSSQLHQHCWDLTWLAKYFRGKTRLHGVIEATLPSDCCIFRTGFTCILTNFGYLEPFSWS